MKGHRAGITREYGGFREVRRVRNRDSCLIFFNGGEHNASSSLQMMMKNERSGLMSLSGLISRTLQSH
jgi:hypothetical protein